MCGRYDLSENPAAIRARFQVPEVPLFAPNADLRPTQHAPIVRRAAADPSPECVLARWGLVPAWARDLKFGARCINARSETVATQAAFRAAFRARRCLVPVNAFYEWSGPAGQRSRWRIGLAGEPLFALAGLWEAWRDPAGGEPVLSYTILTTAANGAIAPIHDRMPVILALDDQQRWLAAGPESNALMAPFPLVRMRIEAA